MQQSGIMGHCSGYTILKQLAPTGFNLISVLRLFRLTNPRTSKRRLPVVNQGSIIDGV